MAQDTITLNIVVDGADKLQSILTQLAIMEERQDTTSSTTDRVNNAYKDGVRDGRAEAQQENAMGVGNSSLAGMVAHDTVAVSVHKGHLPFNFQPAMLTTFGRLSPNKREALGDTAIGTPRDTVGVYGFNMLSKKPMFLVRVDHWTLAPTGNKA